MSRTSGTTGIFLRVGLIIKDRAFRPFGSPVDPRNRHNRIIPPSTRGHLHGAASPPETVGLAGSLAAEFPLEWTRRRARSEDWLDRLAAEETE
jgi:hypothetical protein